MYYCPWPMWELYMSQIKELINSRSYSDLQIDKSYLQLSMRPNYVTNQEVKKLDSLLDIFLIRLEGKQQNRINPGP